MKIFKNDIEKLERLTRRERLGELLIRYRLITLSKLLDLMEEYRVQKSIPLGEFLVEKGLINRKVLGELLNLQKSQDKVINKCLKELGLMTDEEKWARLTKHEKLGELLVRQQKLKLADLIKLMEQQEHTRPERLLGDIVVKEGLLSNDELDIVLAVQQKQIQTIVKTVKELTNIAQLPINVKIRLFY